MKKRIVHNIDILFIAINLIYFVSIQAISVQTNQKFISLVENYLKDNINNKNSDDLLQLDKTKNLNSINQSNNQNNIIKNDKINFNFNPFFENKFEDIKLISSKFLGTLIPKQEKSDKLDKIDCSSLKVSSENYELLKNACDNTTNLIELNLQEGAKINLHLSLKLLECNDDTCKPGQGKCRSSNRCQCDSGFVDNPDQNVNMFCSYKQKRQLLFFLTEFFAPIGLGHILYGRFLYGVIKCSVIVGLIMLDLISKCILLCGKERGVKCPNYVTFFYFAVIVFWQAYDITMIGFNKFREENNIPYIQVEV